MTRHPHFFVFIVFIFSSHPKNIVQSFPVLEARNDVPIDQRGEEATTVPRNLSYYEIDDMMFVLSSRAGQMNQAYRWPKGRIPYTFAPGYNRRQMMDIMLAMRYIEDLTCIQFYDRNKNDQNYLHMQRVSGKCSSFVGNIRKGPQQVALDPYSRKCNSPNFPGHVLHELVHAIGFFHEHARDDRNNYVEIRYQHLSRSDKTRKNFNRNIDNYLSSDSFGVSYNYGSIMHYSQRANSITGQDTIVRKKIGKGIKPPLEGRMGQREKLSAGDIQMIQAMYQSECSRSVDFDDIPDDGDIPDLDDWIEDRIANPDFDPTFPVEEVSPDDIMINVDGDDQSENEVDVDEDYSQNIENRTETSSYRPSTVTFLPSTTQIPTKKPDLTLTTKPATKPTVKVITTRKATTTKLTTKRITTPTVPKASNLFNLMQYAVQNLMKNG